MWLQHRTGDFGSAAYGLLFEDASLLSRSFSNTRRNGNIVVHTLARLAISFPKCAVWMEDVPSQAICFVQADMAALSL